jgi:hypothetical protein
MQDNPSGNFADSIANPQTDLCFLNNSLSMFKKQSFDVGVVV